MIKKIYISMAISILVSIGTVFVLPTVAYGINSIQSGANSAQGDGQPIALFGDSGIFTQISDTLLFVVGALSVMMLIVGGIRYVISGGNTASVTAAKNTVLYAIVGLVVSLLAYASINFVLTTLVSGGSSAGTNI